MWLIVSPGLPPGRAENAPWNGFFCKPAAFRGGVDAHPICFCEREKASRRRLCLLVPGRAGNCTFDDPPSPEEFSSQAQAGPVPPKREPGGCLEINSSVPEAWGGQARAPSRALSQSVARPGHKPPSAFESRTCLITSVRAQNLFVVPQNN